MRAKYGRSRENSPRGEITVAVVSNGSKEMVSIEAFERITQQREDDVNQLQGVLETERNTLRQVMSTAREAVSSLEDDKAVLEDQLFVLEAEIERLRALRASSDGVQYQQKCADLAMLLARKEEEVASLAVQVRLSNDGADSAIRQSTSYDSQATVVMVESQVCSKADSMAGKNMAIRLLNIMLRGGVQKSKLKGFHHWVSSFLAKRAIDNAHYAKVNRMMGVQVDEQKAELQSTIAMLKAEAARAEGMFQVRLDEGLAVQRRAMERESIEIGSIATARVRADAERDMAYLQGERLAFRAEMESLMLERDSLSSALAAATQERVVEPWIVMEDGANLEDIGGIVTTSWKDSAGVLQAKNAEESFLLQVERRGLHNVYHIQMHSALVPANSSEISIILEIAEVQQFKLQKVHTMRNASPPRSRSPGRSGGRASPKSPRGKAPPRSRGDINWDAMGIRTVLEPVPPPAPPGFLERAKKEAEAEATAMENDVEELFGENAAQAPVPKVKVSSFAGVHNTPPRSRRKERTSTEQKPAGLKELNAAEMRAAEEQIAQEKEAKAVREFQEKVAQIDKQGDKPNNKMGWLWKQGGGHDSPKSTTRHSWYRRWFKLEGPLLHYYEQASPTGDGFDDPCAPGHSLRWTGDLRKAQTSGAKLKVSLPDNTQTGRLTLEVFFADRTLTLGAAEDTPVDDAKTILGMWEESLQEHADYFSKPEFALYETF